MGQRERWVPYEQPVKNDANGGFEQANVQGYWSEGQRFSLIRTLWVPARLRTRLGYDDPKSRSVASSHERNRTYLDLNR